MSPRKIFENDGEQRQHEKTCGLLRRAMFSGGKAREVAKAELQKHPGREVHETIVDLRVKRELLAVDLEELKAACDHFWKDALRPGTSHSKECALQRAVWRRAFHVAHASESLTESIVASGRRFAKRKRAKGRTQYEFTVAEFGSRWEQLEKSPLFQFNRALRGALFHSRLVNPDWVGHIDFEGGTRHERFVLKKSVLYTSARWVLEARQYIEENSVASDGSRDSRRPAVGLDLLDHFTRYAGEIGAFLDWFLAEMARPEFGASLGFSRHALAEYIDWRLEVTSVPSEMALCEYCGHPYKL